MLRSREVYKLGDLGVDVTVVPDTEYGTERCSGRDLINQMARRGTITNITKQTETTVLRVQVSNRTIATLELTPAGWWRWRGETVRPDPQAKMALLKRIVQVTLPQYRK